MVAQRKEHLLGWLFTGQHRSLREFVVCLFCCYFFETGSSYVALASLGLTDRPG